jgi:hypothetical protein
MESTGPRDMRHGQIANRCTITIHTGRGYNQKGDRAMIPPLQLLIDLLIAIAIIYIAFKL